jgi:Tfp pilus assembly protein PilF
VPKPKRSAPAAKSSPKRSEPAAAPERPAKARAEEPRAKGDSASAAQLTQTATDAMLRGDFATARVQYEKAIQADRGHAPAWRGRGLVLERMGRTQDAIKSFRRYLKLSPDAPGADKIRARLQSLEAAQ